MKRDLSQSKTIFVSVPRLKNEQLKAEAIDILIDAIHTQTRGGATVSFDHNLALKIEKLMHWQHATGKNHRTGEDPGSRKARL